MLAVLVVRPGGLSARKHDPMRRAALLIAGA